MVMLWFTRPLQDFPVLHRVDNVVLMLNNVLRIVPFSVFSQDTHFGAPKVYTVYSQTLAPQIRYTCACGIRYVSDI